jgi:hypothetical protein
MIEQLLAKPGGDRVRAVVGDMAALDLPSDAPCFGLIYAAFNTIFCLSSLEAQASCFARAAQVLSMEGRLVIEAFTPPNGAIGPGPVEVTHIGETEVVLKVSKWAENGAVVFGHHLEISEEGTRLRPWRMRPLRVRQLDDLAAGAGFELENRFADWDRGPFSEVSRHHLSIYQKIV